MRKTRLVILPTKCLNRMGFLLLFLSCPVIGDWGRIRPDSEMSQRSILIEREGSCGLVRNPIGVKDSTSENLMECPAHNGKLMNGTLTMKNSVTGSRAASKAAAFASETSLHRITVQRRLGRVGRIGTNGEKPRPEPEERSVRREARSLSARGAKGTREASERRVVQADSAHKSAGRLDRSASPQRLLRRTYQERSHRSVDNRRTEHQKDRWNVETRESRVFSAASAEKTQDGSHLVTRRITSALREREGNERRERNNFEKTLRRIEKVRNRRSTNEMRARERTARSGRRQPGEATRERRLAGGDRRVDNVENKQIENGKLTRYEAREMRNLEIERVARRADNRERTARRVATNSERIREAERRYAGGERRLGNDERSIRNMRTPTAREREVVQDRRNENSSERNGHAKPISETGGKQLRTRAKERFETSKSDRQRRSTSQRTNLQEIENRRQSEHARINRERNDGVKTRAAAAKNGEANRRNVPVRRQVNERSAAEREYLVRKERSVDNRQARERRNELMRAERRIEANQSRRIREEGAIGVVASAKERTREDRVAGRILERAAEQRVRTTKVERTAQGDQLETPAPEVKVEKVEASEHWKFLDGARSWISRKNYQESRVIDYRDFTTTCLLGAAVFFLTTRPIKSV